jgi:hypothetical protein
MQPPPPPPPQSLDKLFQERGSRLSSLPPELQDDIKSRVRVFRARKLCNQISTVEAPPLFLRLVTQFIGEAEQNELNPHAVYDTRSGSNNTCLQFVEIRCMRTVSKMYKLVDPDNVPPELDSLRELMIQQLAIRRNNKNKQALRTLRDNSSVEELIYSIQRVAALSYAVLKTSMSDDATPLSEAALALTDECCDQFIMIIGNDSRHITPELKEKAKKLLIEMLEHLHSISQDGNTLSESIRVVGRMMQVKIEQQSWWPQYAQDHGYQQGGNKCKSLKKQSKNNSNRRRASKRKSNTNKNKTNTYTNKNTTNKNRNKNKKKTLRLRIKK